MIPKIIHYCWFGGNPLPADAKRYIESWKKYCPDYKIIEWNETNFDLNYNTYVKEAYQAKKWAFITDVVRLYVLYKYGGIYMDTDVEVLKSLDPILQYDGVSGFESETRIPTGLMACREEHLLFKELLEEYADIHFIKADGSYDMTTNVTRITKTLLEHGLILNNSFQTVSDFTLFPTEYFCPKDCRTGEIKITSNTYTIHHFSGSWDTEKPFRKIVKRVCPTSVKKIIVKIMDYLGVK